MLGTVRHSETLEPMTLYRALYGERGLWVRPAAMFGETAWTIDGVRHAAALREARRVDKTSLSRDCVILLR